MEGRNKKDQEDRKEDKVKKDKKDKDEDEDQCVVKNEKEYSNRRTRTRLIKENMEDMEGI